MLGLQLHIRVWLHLCMENNEAPLYDWSAKASPAGSNTVTWGGASGKWSALLFCWDAEALEAGGGDEELIADNPVRP